MNSESYTEHIKKTLRELFATKTSAQILAGLEASGAEAFHQCKEKLLDDTAKLCPQVSSDFAKHPIYSKAISIVWANSKCVPIELNLSALDSTLNISVPALSWTGSADSFNWIKSASPVSHIPVSGKMANANTFLTHMSNVERKQTLDHSIYSAAHSSVVNESDIALAA